MTATTLALLLCASLPAQAGRPDNFNFATGTLAGWEGEGFYPTPANGHGPGPTFAVCSSDTGKTGRGGMLHRVFVVPRGVGILRVRAYTVFGKGLADAAKMDVMLLAAGKRVIPKQVRTADGWKPVTTIGGRDKGRPHEYLWRIAPYTGQPLRLVLLDDDKRPGCHLVCHGFRFQSADDFDGQEFSDLMVKLTEEHKLQPMLRYETRHFMALSNAEEAFSELRMNNCEVIYHSYFDHFRKKGFKLYEPYSKLMVAMFDTQAGFDAYLGEKLPPVIVGVYHRITNRLVVYDFGTNELFVAAKRQRQAEGKKIRGFLERNRVIGTIDRQAREFRTGANIGTVMHEVAHQLSFNTGMFNREGDVPIWLAEGMACYCESTDNSSWQGIGAFNPERVALLAQVVAAHGRFIPLEEFLTHDIYMRDPKTAILGYSQAWALFRMLMEERPRQLIKFLKLIYPRKTGDHRLTDFIQAFGTSPARMDLRYGQYLKELVEEYNRPRGK